MMEVNQIIVQYSFADWNSNFYPEGDEWRADQRAVSSVGNWNDKAVHNLTQR